MIYCIVFKVASINDKADYRSVCNAMKAVGFSKDDVDTTWKVLGAILHLVCIYYLFCTWFVYYVYI